MLNQVVVHREIIVGAYDLLLGSYRVRAIEHIRDGFRDREGQPMRLVQAKAVVDFMFFIRKSSMGEQREKDGATRPSGTPDCIKRLKQQSREAMRSGKLSEAIRFYNQAWEKERGE